MTIRQGVYIDEIIAPVTTSVSATEFYAARGDTIFAAASTGTTSLAGTEEADLYFPDADGDASGVTLTDSSGAITLTATQHNHTFTAEGRFWVAKDATAGSVGIYIMRPEQRS